jgi:hypothetical protein
MGLNVVTENPRDRPMTPILDSGNVEVTALTLIGVTPRFPSDGFDPHWRHAEVSQ